MEEDEKKLSQWEKVLFSAIAALIATGVIGLWTMAISLGKLEERVSVWTKIYEARFERLDQQFSDFRRDVGKLQR